MQQQIRITSRLTCGVCHVPVGGYKSSDPNTFVYDGMEIVTQDGGTITEVIDLDRLTCRHCLHQSMRVEFKAMLEDVPAYEEVTVPYVQH